MAQSNVSLSRDAASFLAQIHVAYANGEMKRGQRITNEEKDQLFSTSLNSSFSNRDIVAISESINSLIMTEALMAPGRYYNPDITALQQVLASAVGQLVKG